MNNDQQLNKFFDAARNEAPKTSFDETKTQFIKQTNMMATKQSWFNRLINLKNGFIMLAITGLITAGIMLFSGETKEEIKQNNQIENTAITSIDKKEEPKLQLSEPAKTPIQVDALKQGLSSQPQMLASEPVKEEIEKSPVKESVPDLEAPVKPASNDEPRKVNIQDEVNDYHFPTLTKVELDLIKKVKKKLIADALFSNFHKIDYDDYYPSDSNDIDVEEIINRYTTLFYRHQLKPTMVTNEEYRAFLFDLLKKGKKVEFLKAKPNQMNWNDFRSKEITGKLANYYSDNYFIGEETKDYPVVNVSKEGIEMFCEWYKYLLTSSNMITEDSYDEYEVLIPDVNYWNENWKLFMNSKDETLTQTSYVVKSSFGSYGLKELNSPESSDNFISLFNDSLLGSPNVGFRPVIQISSNNLLKHTNEIPELLPFQIEWNNKHKDDLLKSIKRYNGYSMYIEKGIKPHYLSLHEVSILKYRTFLFDLLIQGRDDDFLKAKPTIKNWSKVDYLNYFYTYFSLQAKSHPIGSIPIEGMEMYCKWLTDEFAKAYPNSNRIVRLPRKEEWLIPVGSKTSGVALIHKEDFYDKIYEVDSDKPHEYYGIKEVDKGEKHLRFYHLEGNLREVVKTENGYAIMGGSNMMKADKYYASQEEIQAFHDFSHFYYTKFEEIESNKVSKADVGFRVVVE